MSKQTRRYQMGGKQEASGLLHENLDSGSKHSELFPLLFRIGGGDGFELPLCSLAMWRRTSGLGNAWLAESVSVCKPLMHWGEPLLDRHVELLLFFSGIRPWTRRPSLRERVCSGFHQESRVRESGSCPSGMTPKLAFEEVIKSKDMYSLNRCSVAAFDLDKLNITKTDTLPKPAASLLPPAEADYLMNPELHIIRPQEEIDLWCEANKDFQPYWDETLRQDRVTRIDLYRRLYDKGLLGFRKRIKSRVGIFFVAKASGKGIRLIIDSRMANGCHRRPPKTKLGGASAICELDCTLDDSDFATCETGYGGLVEVRGKLFGNTGDVSDAFYQFSVEPLCEWFGLDDPVEAHEFSLSSVWDPEVKKHVPLGKHERVFPVFIGMPQGWAWALHFCNLAVEYNMSKVICSSQFIKEGLPSPDPRRGPVGSVYVDNIGVFGFVEKAVDDSFDGAVDSLESAGFVLHELERGAVEVQNVGIVLRRDSMTVRHTKKRSWRLYLALKHVLGQGRITTEALRVIVGHIVHYFSIQRAGMSTLYHTDKFIFKWLDGRSHDIPGPAKRELRVVIGFIFQVEIDLRAPYVDRVYCGDSSTYGYCFQWTPSTSAEQRDLFKFHERWRFLEVEAHTGTGLGSHHSWSADFELPDISYVRWLCKRMG